MKNIFLLVLATLLLFSSCSGPIPNFGEFRVLNKTLVLIEMDSVKFPDNEKSGEIYIKFISKKGNDNEGSILGFGGCNNLYGTYKSTTEDIPKVKVEMTDKYCEKSGMEKKLVEMMENLDLIELGGPDFKNNKIANFFSDSPRHRAYFKIME